ncbi:MAG: iron-sulfur cluster loop [Anaerolineae bacterium]|nr:iron-sulfur cluster loop [Anaerolineae bacterium]
MSESTIAKLREIAESESEFIKDAGNFVPGDAKANALLSNLTEYPHLFVLGCVMDRQIKAERAWLVPIRIGHEIGSFAFEDFAALTLNQLQALFREHGLHFLINDMPPFFYQAIQHIAHEYNGYAANIWNDNPSSARVVRRFMRFRGIGPKIATMAANILARDFKIAMRDKVSIDISPDRHTRRVFYRLGLIYDQSDSDDLVYAAREINPEYPGLLDYAAFKIGREWCKERKPLCNQCLMNTVCLKKMGQAKEER